MKPVPLILAAALALASAATAQNPPAAPTTGTQAPSTGTGLLGLPPSTDVGVQKAQQLLEQMVQALGGAAYLNIQDMEQYGRTFSFYHGESAGTGAPFWRFWKYPDKDRTELTKKRDWVIIYNGDKGYDITFRGTAAVEKEQLDDYLRRRQHSLQWVLRKWLKEPGVALFYEGSATAERKQAQQISILNGQNDGVTVSIDATTHLPLRIAFQWRDPQYHDHTDEAEGYDGYRPVQGIMTPFNITRYKQGEAVNQRFITETKYNQNLPDSLFAATITYDPNRSPRKK